MKTIEIPFTMVFNVLDEDEVIVRAIFKPEDVAENIADQQKAIQSQIDSLVAQVRNAARDMGQTPAEFIAAAEAEKA